MSPMTKLCATIDCVNEARKDGLCWGCYKRRQRGLPPAPVRTSYEERVRLAKQRLEDAAYELGAFDSDESRDAAFENARRRFWAAHNALVKVLAEARVDGTNAVHPDAILAAECPSPAGRPRRAS